MNERSDEATKQPSETSQPEAQEQSEYWEVSRDELKQILEAHQEWLESDQEQGKQTNLVHTDLGGADLQGANLRGADLKKAIHRETFTQ